MSPPQTIYLASRSPRRRELLNQIGVAFATLDVDVDEALGDNEWPADYVVRLALDKARAGWLAPDRRRDMPVLGSDTVVVVDDQVLGKPRDRAHALEMLARLSGRSHEVLTAVALVRGEHEAHVLSRTQVRFRDLGRPEAQAYWDSGEPTDKAGAYAIQGLGAVFVTELQGSYSGVMGLPLSETARLLAGFGIDVLTIEARASTESPE